MDKLVSIIVPCYNSTPILKRLVTETEYVLKSMDVIRYEFIFVNDCSPNEESYRMIKEMAESNQNIKLVNLAKNTGQANAQVAALNYAMGDYIINMDDDMQTHPKNIPLMWEKLQEGYDVVVGRYAKKKHSLFRNLLTKADNIFESVVLHKDRDLLFTSFWIMRKYIRDEIIRYQYPFAFMEGLILRTSNRIANVEIEHFERVEGTSGYNLKSLIKLWSNFTNFTVLPLRIAGFFGALTSFVGFIYAFVILIRKIMNPLMPAGYASIVCMMLIFFGIVLCFLGIIGEYIGRIFMCINNAPQYVVKETINIEKKGEY